MAKIEGIRVANYRVLRDVTLGKLWNTQKATPLTPMTAVIGKNGVGKSSVFDAFGFLGDCLKLGVEEACDVRGRGGFQRIRSQGSTGPIEFEIYYRQDSSARPITYELAIDVDSSSRPYVARERLRQRRKGQRHGRPFSFLMMRDGRGLAWKGDALGSEEPPDFDLDSISSRVEQPMEGAAEESTAREEVALDDKRRLGIATLGALKQHPRIASFRQFVEGWYISVHADNLGNVVQFMERQHRNRFRSILQRVAERLPGIDNADTEHSPDGRLLLQFNDTGFEDPFYAQQVSDSTLKLFAYLLMLEAPSPPPIICIEEPANGLYHKLLDVLAREFRSHATGRRGTPQIFVTTHQPYFVDALAPRETWILEKRDDGFAAIRRASEDPIVESMVNEGLPLGNLWYSGYLRSRRRP